MPIHASARRQHLATHPPRSRPRCPQGRRWQSLRAGWIPSGFCRRIRSGRALAQILLKRKNRRQVALPNLVIPSPAGCCWRLRHAAISSPRFFGGGTGRSGPAPWGAPSTRPGHRHRPPGKGPRVGSAGNTRPGARSGKGSEAGTWWCGCAGDKTSLWDEIIKIRSGMEGLEWERARGHLGAPGVGG